MPPAQIAQRIAALRADCGGELSFVIRDLISGVAIMHGPDHAVPTASVYKLYVLVYVACALEESCLSWDTPLVLSPVHVSPGTGVLKGMTPGVSLTLRDACMLMIAVSDNTAANMVLEYVGLAAINRRLHELGLAQTALIPQQRTPDAPGLPLATGRSTPRETAKLLTLVARGLPGRQQATADLRVLLATQQDHTMIGRFLPPGWTYCGKSGADADARADVGLVTAPDAHTYVLALFCHGLPMIGWSVDHPAVLALARLARWALWPGITLESYKPI